jgi:hypothetical protein
MSFLNEEEKEMLLFGFFPGYFLNSFDLNMDCCTLAITKGTFGVACNHWLLFARLTLAFDECYLWEV